MVTIVNKTIANATFNTKFNLTNATADAGTSQQGIIQQIAGSLKSSDFLIISAVAGLILVFLLLYVIWRITDKDVIYKKKIEDGRSVVTVKTKKPFKRIILADKVDGEEVNFVRERISKDETIQFVYPISLDKARLTVEDEKKSYSVELPVV